MIPIEDTTPQRRRHFPAVTLLLIAANAAVFVYELALGPDLQDLVRSLGLVPAQITTGRAVLWPPPPIPVYLTLVTSMFLHASLLHLGGNMLFLWIFGDNVEDALGHLPFLGFYFLCGIVAGVAQILTDPMSLVPSIGASGAIAGVLAAYLLLYPGSSVRTLLFAGPFITITRISALFMIGVWIVIQVISGLVELSPLGGSGSGVAFWAHIGGFAAGLGLVWGGRAVLSLRSRGSGAGPEP